jgi:hypothetical protein
MYVLGASYKRTMLTTIAELGCVHYPCKGVVAPTFTESLLFTQLKGVVVAHVTPCVTSSKSCDIIFRTENVNFDALHHPNIEEQQKCTYKRT